MITSTRKNNYSYKLKHSLGSIKTFIDRQYKKFETILNANNKRLRKANKT